MSRSELCIKVLYPVFREQKDRRIHVWLIGRICDTKPTNNRSNIIGILTDKNHRWKSTVVLVGKKVSLIRKSPKNLLVIGCHPIHFFGILVGFLTSCEKSYQG